MKTFFLTCAFALLFFADTCSNREKLVEVTGTIQEQGITSYQYGSHTISSGETTFALRSEKIDLNNYIDKKVTVFGKKVAGYPVDGGPEFLEVQKVKD